MQLSEAIATGRILLYPQAGFLVNGEGGGCALGMALAAIGREVRLPQSLTEPIAEWKWTDECITESPCGCALDSDGSCYAEAIAHIFDLHICGETKPRWTLDQLIDWVRSVEPPEPAAAVSDPQSLSASGAQPDLGVETVALPLNTSSLDRMVEEWRDAEAGTR